MKFFFLIFFSTWIYTANAQNPACYKIFNASGKEVSFDEIMNKALNSNMVFFGEYHNDPIGHWFELIITQTLNTKAPGKLILGSEMFESDNQLILSEYLNGIIPVKKFEDEARLWPNYQTDYKPITDYAFENKIPFIATNIPRRYASIVASSGLEILVKTSIEAQKYIAPLPIKYDANLNCYKSMMEMGGMKGGHGDPSNFPKAQAIKDATMAHFILSNYSDGKIFFHFNGSFHSDNHEGIVWYLKEAKKELKILVISTVSQKDISSLNEDNLNLGDYILCVPENMTKTH